MSNVQYKLMNSMDDMGWVTEAVAKSLGDSPFKKLTVNMDILKDTISQFCVDTSDTDRFAMLAVLDGEIIGIMAASVLDNHFIFANHKAGQEMLWWVHEDHRKSDVSKELMEALDSWAKYKGLEYVFLSHYHNEYADKMSKMYESMGYTPVEYTHWKEMG